MKTKIEFENPCDDIISDEFLNDINALLKGDISNKKFDNNFYNSKINNKNNKNADKSFNYYLKEDEKLCSLDINEEATKDTNKKDKKDLVSKKVQKVNNNQDLNKNHFLKVNIKNNSFNNCDEKLNLIKINSKIDCNRSKYIINLQFDLNRKYKLNLIGNKRKNEDKKIYNNEEKFNNICKLYNKYIGNFPDYKILEQQNGFFNKNYTIIEGDIPICVIYFQNKLIKEIYSIIDQKFIYDNKLIFEVLDCIESNIKKYKLKNPFKFAK